MPVTRHFRIMHCLSIPADSLGAFTCLGGVAATGKLPRDISTLIHRIQCLAVAGSSQTKSGGEYTIASMAGVRFRAVGSPPMPGSAT
jgi:hypothetical protein